VITRDQVTRNIDSLIQRTASLPEVLSVLAGTGIRYGLYAGAHVAVLTDNRPAADVDFLVHDDDIDALADIFPSAGNKRTGSATFFSIDGDGPIEFMARANIRKDGAVYPFRLTDLALGRVGTYDARLASVKVVDPVDTLLLKALLRRGRDQGKHDLEDIQAVLAQVEIDTGYLRARLEESGAAGLTAGVWREFGVIA
jgi:hypothetical protein